MKQTSVLITSFFPPISYFYFIVHSEKILIEVHENYDRQTIRNRCYILSPNGVQYLSIPIVKTDNRCIKDIEIDYSVPWNSKHAHAIRSAYGKSPFFCYYYDDLVQPLFKKHKYLLDLNNELLHVLCKMLHISCNVQFTETYAKTFLDANDLRSVYVLTKNPPFVQNLHFEPYIQCFSDRYAFCPDLSIIDLLFNMGPESLWYLKNQKLHV